MSSKKGVEKQIKVNLERIFIWLQCELDAIDEERREFESERKRLIDQIADWRGLCEELEKKNQGMLMYKDRCVKAEAQMQLLQRQLNREHQQAQVRHEQQFIQIREKLKESKLLSDDEDEVTMEK
jgi:septal ring factor EnvC (AmiA/AmiB activator)